MSRIFRYTFFQVLRTNIMVAGVLLAMVWLSQSLPILNMIVNQGLSVGGFLQISALRMPSFLSLILPISLFVGVLIVYVRLLNDRELIVMRAGGLGQLRTMSPAFAMAVITSLLMYLVNLYLMPAGYRQFKDLQYELRNDLSSKNLREGAFNTFGDDLTVYVRNRSDSGILNGLLLHNSRGEGTVQTYMAERAALLKTAEGPRIVLENGNRQEVDKTTGQLSSLYFDRYVFDLSQFVETQPQQRWRKASERFVGELLNPDLSDPNNIANIDKFRAEAHNRLAWPLYPFAFVFLASLAVVAGSFDRRGVWKRLVPVGLAFAATLVTGIGLQSITSNTPSLLPLLYLTPLTICILCLWLLYRSPKRRTA